MTDDLETARAAIVARLELVLPGRVLAHPPTTRRYVTPSIYVEDPTVSQIGSDVIAEFPVWIVVDGAVQAQVAMLDRLRWNAWLACAPIAGGLAARPVTLAGYRASVLEVTVGVTVETLCGLPPPVAVVIPTPANKEA